MSLADGDWTPAQEMLVCNIVPQKLFSRLWEKVSVPAPTSLILGMCSLHVHGDHGDCMATCSPFSAEKA
jgi:hypothetical protein